MKYLVNNCASSKTGSDSIHSLQQSIRFSEQIQHTFGSLLRLPRSPCLPCRSLLSQWGEIHFTGVWAQPAMRAKPALTYLSASIRNYSDI
jgi:hypothetical protein